MGSLMREQGGWIIIEKPSSSPLIPFHQRQNNHSPLESPPIAKKLPKVKDGNLFFGQMFVESPSASTLPLYLDLADGKENRSILKKSSGLRTRSGRPGRHVDFEQDVVVYHFDRVEGSHVSSESQRLSSDHKDRKEFVNRNIQGRNRPNVVDTHSTKISLFGSREPPIQYAVPLPVTSSLPVSSSSPSQYTEMTPQLLATSQYAAMSSLQYSHHPIDHSTSFLDHRVQGRSGSDEGLGSESQEVDFSFFEDDEHRLWLKFMIPLGDGVAANDVLVKANTAGNKVRLVGTRTIGTSRHGTIIRQEFTERYQLPMEVDPYKIIARMNDSGNLYVEAPVMTADRKRALAIERQTTGDHRLGSISSDFVL